MEQTSVTPQRLGSTSQSCTENDKTSVISVVEIYGADFSKTTEAVEYVTELHRE
jgi:hypothetical protein